jgi:hypothetical protein
MGAIKQLLIAAQEGDRQARARVARMMGQPRGCTCIPREPDDQCVLHGYEAWKARRARTGAEERNGAA